MTEQDNTPIFESKKYAQELSELINKIASNKLNKEELKTAKKTLQDIQKLVSASMEVFNNMLPDLTSTEKKIVDAQKFGIAELVIKQIFDSSDKILNQSEQSQFIELLTKVLESGNKGEKKKIFRGSDSLKEALYLHNDDARREKLKK
jgi:iron uptake system EfeUOB component EfeO/EfeM